MQPLVDSMALGIALGDLRLLATAVREAEAAGVASEAVAEARAELARLEGLLQRSENTVATLVEALTIHSEKPLVCAHACGVLLTIAAGSSFRAAKVLEAGAAPLLAAVWRDHREAQENAARALEAIGCREDGNSKVECPECGSDQAHEPTTASAPDVFWRCFTCQTAFDVSNAFPWLGSKVILQVKMKLFSSA